LAIAECGLKKQEAFFDGLSRPFAVQVVIQLSSEYNVDATEAAPLVK
jgi:hypothetical protein